MAKSKPHRPNKRICSWTYCSLCGLVYLNNEVTRKAVKKPCPGHDEQQGN